MLLGVFTLKEILTTCKHKYKNLKKQVRIKNKFIFIKNNHFMSIQKNINQYLERQFIHNDYLPKKLLLEDLDAGVFEYIKSLNISIYDKNDKLTAVPVVFLTQEKWAEFKVNWKDLKDESGEEIRYPFISIRRMSVKPGQNPLKRTIPNKKKFTFVKIPILNGELLNYELYKIPQPPRVDVTYEMRFFSHYLQDTNVSYEKMIADGFSDGQGYMDINGYPIPLMLDEPSEETTSDDITSERSFQTIFPLKLYGKIVDPINFERVETINKIQINISEK